MPGERPPAGWYHDGRALRWWDGQVWGPYAPYPPRASGENSIMWATLVHFGFAAGGFIGPLVLRLTEGRTDEFVRHHSTEALNGNLTILLAYLGAYLPGFAGSVALGALWPLFVGLGVTVLVVGVMVAQMILGGVRASRGRWFRYPLTIRFVRGGLARGETRPIVQRPAASTPGRAYVPPARLPGPLRALREGAADLRRRPRAWAGVGSGALALTLAPYFVAVGVNDLAFRYDLWNDVPPSPTANWVAVASLIASGVAGFTGLALGWGWMAALASDPGAGSRTSLRRSAGASLRRVWYAAPAMVVAALACATVVGAPLAVGFLAPAAFPLMSLRPSRPGWLGRVLGHALVIGLVMAAAALIVYVSWAVGAIVDANVLAVVAIFAACALEVTVAVALVASTLGVLHQADASLGSGRPSTGAWPAP